MHRPELVPQFPPSVFSRPRTPDPAPLVWINGWLGVGKEAAAERLSMLLRPNKSFLVNVLGISGSDDDAPLTPEHPGYFYSDVPAAAASPPALSAPKPLQR